MMATSTQRPEPAPNNLPIDLAAMDPVFEQYRGQKGALIPILQRAQSIYGYLPPQVQRRIAERLGIAPGKVYGVATFYAQFYFEPRGRHVLRLCDGTACHVKGTPALLTAVEDNFDVAPGHTSDDGQLTVEIVYCLGSCALAPVAVLDGQVMGRIRQEALLNRVRRSVSGER